MPLPSLPHCVLRLLYLGAGADSSDANGTTVLHAARVLKIPQIPANDNSLLHWRPAVLAPWQWCMNLSRKNCQNSTSELRAQNYLSSQEVVHKADGPAEQAGCLLAIHQTAKYLSPFESIFSL